MLGVAIGDALGRPVERSGDMGPDENWVDRAVMKLAGTDQAITVCKNDLKIADKALNSINEYKNGSASQNVLSDNLEEAVSGFQKSSEDFQPLVAKTVSFAFIGTIIIFISN